MIWFIKEDTRSLDNGPPVSERTTISCSDTAQVSSNMDLGEDKSRFPRIILADVLIRTLAIPV